MTMADDVRAEITRMLNDVRTTPLTLHLPPSSYNCPSCPWTTSEILKPASDPDTAEVHLIALDAHIRTRHDQHHLEQASSWPFDMVEDPTVPDDEIQLRSGGRIVGRIHLDNP